MNTEQRVLKAGMLLLPRAVTMMLHKRHDTHEKITVGDEIPMMVWDFHEIPEDHDPMCGMELEFLINAEIWAFPVPRDEHWSDYFRTLYFATLDDE